MKRKLFFFFILISSFAHAQVGSPFLKKYFNVTWYGAKGDGVTNDGPAIKRARDAARAYPGLGIVYFPQTGTNIYQVNDPIDSTYSGYDCNCQIPIPVDSADGNRAYITFLGEMPPNFSITGGASTGTPTFQGIVIRSGYAGTRSTRVTGTAIIGTNGPNIGGVGNGENLNYLHVENLAFVVKNNPNGAGPEIGGVNYRHGASVNIKNCTYSIDTGGSVSTMPTRPISGFETSDCDNEANNTINNALSIGAKYGYILGEHTAGDQLSTYLCYYGFGVKWGNHASSINRALAQWIVYGIGFVDQGSNCQVTPMGAINFDLLDIEGSASCYPGKWFNLIYAVNDSLNRITGNVRYWMSNCGTGGNGSASWNSNGGTNFKQTQLGGTPPAGGTLASVLASGNSAEASQQVWLKNYTPTDYALRVGGFRLQPMSPDNTAVLWNSHFNGSVWVRDTAATAGMIQFAGGTTYFRNAPTGATGSTITWTFPIVIQSNNNVSFSNISNSPTDYGTGLVQAANQGGAQFSAVYDASHHSEFTTGSNGVLTLTPSGITTKFTAATTAGASINIPSGTPSTTLVAGNMATSNGLFIIDSSASKRDTIATRSWTTTSIGNLTLPQVISHGATFSSGAIIDLGTNVLQFNGSSSTGTPNFTNSMSTSGLDVGNVTITSGRAITYNDYIIQCNASGGNINMTGGSLPTGQIITIFKLDASANTVTFTPSGTVNGASSVVLSTQYKYVTVASGGAGSYIIIGSN